MKFSYIATDTTGQLQTGTIDASSKLEAADLLFSQHGLTVTSLSTVEGASTDAPASPKPAPEITTARVVEAMRLHIGEKHTEAAKATTINQPRSLREWYDQFNELTINLTPIQAQDKVVLFRLLAAMINAGMPIVRSLKTLVTHTSNPRLKRILADISESVERGNSFSKALADFDTVFTEAEVGIIATGESSGQLNKALTDLAIQTEKHASLMGKIRSALTYPAVVLTVLVGVTVIVMTKVVPTLTQLFSESGAELPLATRVLVSISDWFLENFIGIPHWLLVLAFIPGLIAVIGILRRTKDGRLMWDRLLINLPIFGVLFRKVALASFARQLSMLTNAGVSIIRALEISAHAIGNAIYESEILSAKEAVERGVPIHKAISDENNLFPPLVVSMIAVGEETAQLGETTKKIAEYYDEEVDRFVGNMSTIMEPLIIVFVGTLVGLIVAAIMQPIMSIADIASQQ